MECERFCRYVTPWFANRKWISLIFLYLWRLSTFWSLIMRNNEFQLFGHSSFLPHQALAVASINYRHQDSKNVMMLVDFTYFTCMLGITLFLVEEFFRLYALNLSCLILPVSVPSFLSISLLMLAWEDVPISLYTSCNFDEKVNFLQLSYSHSVELPWTKNWSTNTFHHVQVSARMYGPFYFYCSFFLIIIIIIISRSSSSSRR